METITFYFDMPGLEVSADNRRELAQTIDKALQDSGGTWVGCRYSKDTIAIHAIAEDEEQARSLIRSAIKEHPVFSRMGYHDNLYTNIR